MNWQGLTMGVRIFSVWPRTDQGLNSGLCWEDYIALLKKKVQQMKPPCRLWGPVRCLWLIVVLDFKPQEITKSEGFFGVEPSSGRWVGRSAGASTMIVLYKVKKH
jgi:hypothetical protein